MSYQETGYNGEHLTGQSIEVGGISVKCIASNIRRPIQDWNIGIELVQSIGKEGELIAVEALSDFGSTTHVENQTGRDEHIYRGDRFIGVLANRFSGTSESGGVPLEGIEFCEDTVVHLLATGGVIGINTGIPQLGTTTIWIKQGKFASEEPLNESQEPTFTLNLWKSVPVS